MIRIIMVGCNGKMGQNISQIVAEDAAAEIVAGVDFMLLRKMDILYLILLQLVI